MTDSRVTQDAEARAIAAYEQSVKDSAAVGALSKIAMRAMLRDHDYTWIEETRDGTATEKVDTTSIRKAVFRALKDADVKVTTQDERDTLPLDRDVVIGKVLFNLPTPTGDPEAWDALDAETRSAWKKVAAYIWGKLAGTKPGDPLQRWTAEEFDGLYLVKTDGDEMYLTGEPQFIKADVIVPVTDDLEIRSINAGEVLGLIAKQVPAVKKVGRQALKRATKRAGEKADAAYLLKSGGDADDDE